MREFEVEIISEGRLLYKDRAFMVVARSVEGEIGILARHIPLLTILGEGKLRVKKTSEQVMEFYVKSGYLEVGKDKVLVICRCNSGGL